MNKNIVIVGVLDSIESTNTSLAKAFIKLGFTVYPVNYRAIISDRGHEFFEKYLLRIIEKVNPYLTIFCKCNAVNPETVKKATELAKTWLWNPDPVITIDRCPEVIEHMKNCTYVSHTAKGAKETYDRRYSLSNSSHHILCGLDYDLYKPTDVVDDYKTTISFIGSRNSDRDRVYKILDEEKINVKFYGPGFTDYIDHKRFSQICSSSKFMLSYNNEQLTDYFSNRLLRYLGCGVCTIHYDPTQTLNKYFECGKEILFFKNDEELINLIKNTTLEQAGKIALNGREKVLRCHTWEHVVVKILNIVGGETIAEA